jgi:hypothetical protein
LIDARGRGGLNGDALQAALDADRAQGDEDSGGFSNARGHLGGALQRDLTDIRARGRAEQVACFPSVADERNHALVRGQQPGDHDAADASRRPDHSGRHDAACAPPDWGAIAASRTKGSNTSAMAA